MKTALREPFSTGAKAVVAKPFTFGGRTYAAGDSFPWRKLSCSVRKAQQLWENRLISCETTSKAIAPKSDSKAKPMTKPAKEETADESQTD